MATLTRVSHSEPPLKAHELCHVPAVKAGAPNLNTSNVPSIGALLAYCQELVVDKEASTVRLTHFTLQEYLRGHLELFGTAHSAMVETYLSYLSASPFSDLQDTPFPGYPSLC